MIQKVILILLLFIAPVFCQLVFEGHIKGDSNGVSMEQGVVIDKDTLQVFPVRSEDHLGKELFFSNMQSYLVSSELSHDKNEYSEEVFLSSPPKTPNAFEPESKIFRGKLANTSQVIFEREPNDSFSWADPLKIDEMIGGNFNSSVDIDFFSFSLPQFGLYSFYLVTSVREQGNESNLLYFVYSGDRQVLGSFVSNTRRQEFNLALYPGDYYIGVASGSIIEYKGNNNFETSLTYGVGYERYDGPYLIELEPNDLISNAHPIGNSENELLYGQEIEGSMSSYGDIDNFYYKMREAGSLEVRFRTGPRQRPAATLFVQILNENGQMLDEFYVSTNKTIRREIGVPKGEYYVSIRIDPESELEDNLQYYLTITEQIDIEVSASSESTQQANYSKAILGAWKIDGRVAWTFNADGTVILNGREEYKYTWKIEEDSILTITDFGIGEVFSFYEIKSLTSTEMVTFDPLFPANENRYVRFVAGDDDSSPTSSSVSQDYFAETIVGGWKIEGQLAWTFNADGTVVYDGYEQYNFTWKIEGKRLTITDMDTGDVWSKYDIKSLSNSEMVTTDPEYPDYENRYVRSVKDTKNREKKLNVVAKVGRRESVSPLRTRVDRSVDFTVYSFTRDDSSDMEIVEDFEWDVPSRLVGKIESVGSLDLTTVAKVDEEIIFRVGSAQSTFRVITTPSKAVEVVIDPPILEIEPGENQRFSAKALDKYGNNVVRNFGWHVVGDIGTIDGRRGDFKSGNKPGEGWIIAVANTQLIFSDVEATLEGAGKVVVGGGTPQLYSLEQNTPNPFNPSTQISFQLPISSHVRLTVFNALGQPVEQLIDAPMNSGSHQVEWRSNDHRSGVYFYELRTEPIGETNFFNLKVEPFVARKKMLLVR